MPEVFVVRETIYMENEERRAVLHPHWDCWIIEYYCALCIVSV